MTVWWSLIVLSTIATEVLDSPPSILTNVLSIWFLFNSLITNFPIESFDTLLNILQLHPSFLSCTAILAEEPPKKPVAKQKKTKSKTSKA